MREEKNGVDEVSRLGARLRASCSLHRQGVLPIDMRLAWQVGQAFSKAERLQRHSPNRSCADVEKSYQ